MKIVKQKIMNKMIMSNKMKMINFQIINKLKIVKQKIMNKMIIMN